jgi:Zn-dependent alcohol dehydrogenase
MAFSGTFAEPHGGPAISVIKSRRLRPLAAAAGCGVSRSAALNADIAPGDSVAVIGCGGVDPT